MCLLYPSPFYVCELGLSRLIDSNRIDSSSQPINRFKTPESIH